MHACALKGKPGLAEVLGAVTAPEVVFAPLLMAEGYTPEAMRRQLDRTRPPAARLIVCRPIGVHPRLGDIVRDKALARCTVRSWQPAVTALLIVGHGTGRHAESGATARWHAGRIAAQGVFAEVAVAFLDEAPRVPAALEALRAPHCVAVGLFVDAGEHGEDDVPTLLTPARARAVYAGRSGRIR